jgi:Condensation domain
MTPGQLHLSTRGADTYAAAPTHNNDLQSRPLLLLERTMYRDGSAPFMSVFTVRLRGTLYENGLRNALARLQEKHALLRCVIEDSEGRPHFVLQDCPAPIRLRIVERKNENEWEDEVRREWVEPFDTRSEPLLRMVWLRASREHELILIGHHCICDGQSGMTLLRECLSAYDDRGQDSHPSDSLRTVEDLVPVELRQRLRFQIKMRMKVSLFRLGLLLKRKNHAEMGVRIAGEQMYFHRWRLDTGTSQSFMGRCRAEGATVHAASSVAFLQAFREIRGTAGLQKAYSMVNARRFLPLLKADALLGIAPGIEVTLKKLPQPKNMSVEAFWECARAIKQDMTRRIDRLGSELYEYLVGLESLHDKYDRLIDDTEAASIVCHVTLSNMGRLDLPKQYRTFAIEAVYSPLVMVSPTPANTVILSSFAGQLEFAIVSDTQSLPRAHALSIEQRAMDIIRGCAGIPEEHSSGLSVSAIALGVDTA